MQKNVRARNRCQQISKLTKYHISYDHRFPGRVLRERVREDDIPQGSVRVSWGRGQSRLCVLCCYDEIGSSRCDGPPLPSQTAEGTRQSEGKLGKRSSALVCSLLL